MKILKIDERIEQALGQVLDLALKAGGLQVKGLVDLILNSIEVEKKGKKEGQ